MGVWPQFRSPLTWDFFAVLTYLIVSICFWYIGLVPDLASARDRATKRRWQVFFGIFALGWRGSGTHWLRWRQAYLITAAIAVPLVVSVHSEISMLFAAGPIPGWSSTIFPPYFVLGAAFSGFAVVTMLAVVVRSMLRLKDLVTERHLDMLGRLTLATGLMTAFGYVAETYTSLYAGSYEAQTVMDRFAGPYLWSFWGAVFFNFVPIQLLWWRKMRVSPVPTFLIGLSVAVGGFLMQVYPNVVYPLDIGGRPMVAVPAFMMITFELLVLTSVLVGIGTMFAKNRLPRLHYPLFDARRFHLASDNRFFVSLVLTDGADEDAARGALERQRPSSVEKVGGELAE
jgi:Ni/Fe-hydrogenase subunit HybB-like protein